MRLVNLYAGEEKNLAFVQDVAKLEAHMEKIEKSNRWEAVSDISEGINRITAAGGGKPLSEDGIRGIQQLICKVRPPPLAFSLMGVLDKLAYIGFCDV
jgi:hypothetical protein